MTIDDALELVGQTKECWIVWSSATGEVIDVRDASRAEPSSELAHLKQYSGRIQTRWFDSSKVTRKVLEDAARDIARVRERSAILAAWRKAPLEELLWMLERDNYSFPMERDFDSRIIVDYLWELHRDELDPVARGRLRALLDRRK